MTTRIHHTANDGCGQTAPDTSAQLRSLIQTRDTIMDMFFRSIRLNAPNETMLNLAAQVKRIDRVIAEMDGAK